MGLQTLKEKEKKYFHRWWRHWYPLSMIEYVQSLNYSTHVIVL